MKRLIQILVAVIATPALALAAGGGDGHASISTLFWPWVNFVCYLFIMFYGYRKLAKPRLVEQHTEIKQQLEKTSMDILAAEEALAEAKQRLENISAEQEALIVSLEEEGRNVAEAVIIKAEQNAQRSKLDAKRRIEGEIAKLESELRSQVVRKAAEIARREIGKQLSDNDDMRLRQEALQRL